MTTDRWEIRAVERRRLIVEDGQWHASAYWDGDVALNGPGTYVEILSLDVLIDHLQSLRELARKHFGPDWGKE